MLLKREEPATPTTKALIVMAATMALNDQNMVTSSNGGSSGEKKN